MEVIAAILHGIFCYYLNFALFLEAGVVVYGPGYKWRVCFATVANTVATAAMFWICKTFA